MLAAGIENIKEFMAKLFKGNMFDDFEMKECKIDAAVKIEIDGRLGKEYVSENRREFIRWKGIKENIFNFIRGRITPKSIKIIFQLPESRLLEIGENVASASLNIIFEGGSLVCTAAISQKSFSMDKKDEMIWEEKIKQFLFENNFNI